MKNSLSIIFVIFIFTISSCTKTNVNPNIPKAIIRIDIDPNSTFYQSLNTVGGWTYIADGDQGALISKESRGVIIYRSSQNEFKAYDRIPPNNPDKCCSDDNVCTKLIVGENFPFAKDPCTGNLYSLLDGSLFKGSGQYPMIEYHAVYDGALLHVFN